MKKLQAVGILVIVLFLSSITTITAVDIQSLYTEARSALYENQDYEKVIENTTILIENFDSIAKNYHPLIYYMRGQAHKMLEQDIEAVSWMELAMEKKDDLTLTENKKLLQWSMLDMYILAHRFDEAQKALPDFIHDYPDDIRLYKSAYWMYTDDLDKPDEALDILSLGLEHNPGDTTLLQLRALQYENINQREEAIADYSMLIQLTGDSGTYYYRDRARLLYEIGKYGLALEDVTTYMDHPYMVLIGKDCELRGDIYRELGNLDLAKDDYREAIIKNAQIDVNDYQVYAKLADILLEQGQYLDAINEYSNAIITAGYYYLLYPPMEFGEYYRGMGYSSAQLGYFGDALEYYNSALEIDYENSEFYRERAEVYIALGYAEEAFNDLDYCFVLEELPSLETFRARGYLFYQTGNIDAAIADYRHIAERSSYDPDAWSDLGKLYMETGMYEDAVTAFSRNLGMRFADTYYWTEEMYLRAFSYASIGDTDAALKDLNILIELDETQILPINLRAQIYETAGNTSMALEDYKLLYRIISDYYMDNPQIAGQADAVQAKIDRLQSNL